MSGIRMEMGLANKQIQTMVLAPRMIQSMEILQLPIMALQERIQQELQENPVLELKDTTEDANATEGEAGEGVDEPGQTVAEEKRDPGAGELVIDDTGKNELDFDRLDAL